MEPAEYELMCEMEDDALKAIGYKRGLLRAAEMAEAEADRKANVGETLRIAGAPMAATAALACCKCFSEFAASIRAEAEKE